MFRMIFIFCICMAVSPVLSQELVPSAAEDSLFLLFEQFQTFTESEDRQAHNDLILDYMQVILSEPESFDYRFDSLRKRAGILKDEDNMFRIFTWNIPLSAWEHDYHGIIQIHNKRDNSCRVYLLKNHFHEIPDLLHSETRKDMWPGALYYEMRRNKHGKEIIYTLLGFNFNDRWSDKKIIEILHFDKNMNPVFGKPVFKTPEGVQHRVVFEYSGEVAMNLRYNPDLKMIVYDHLSPIEPELAAHPRFYAPDFSYDGYKFKRGIWEYRSDLDVRNR